MEMQSSPDKKLRTYAKFKNKMETEPYLITIKYFHMRKNFVCLRTSSHNLYIETGRHRRPVKVPVNERLCDHCNLVEDETHYVLVCEKFDEPRKQFLEQLSEIFPTFGSLDLEEKFIFIMKCQDYEVINLLAQYLSETTKIRGDL